MALTLLIFLVISIIAGTNTALLKYTVSQYPPFILVALRFSLATLILVPFIIKQKSSFKNGHRSSLFLSSLMFAISIILATYSLQFTSVTMHQIIWTPQSLVVAAIAFLVLGEKLTKSHVIGLVITLFGALIIINQIIGSGDFITFGTQFGNFLSILAFVCSCFFVVFSKQSSKFYSPLAIVFVNFLTAAILSLILIPLENSAASPSISSSRNGIIAVFSLALFSSVAVYWLYQILVKRTMAFIVTLTHYVSIVFAIALGSIFYQERISSELIFSIAMVVFGVLVATSSKEILDRLKLQDPITKSSL